MTDKPRLVYKPGRFSSYWLFYWNDATYVGPFRTVAAALNIFQSTHGFAALRSIAQPSNTERADAATNPQRSRDPRLLDEQSPRRHLQQ